MMLVVLGGPCILHGQQDVVAATPPMGWNSWDAYGLTITEDQFRANAKVLAEKLKPFGWEYAVIDEGWFLKNPLDRPKPELLQYEIDGNGRYIPVPSRFASAVNAKGVNEGFKKLGSDIHGMGLKFGIHIVRGIPRVAVAANLPVEGSAFHAVDVADKSDVCPWDPTNWGVRNDAAGQAWYDSLLTQYAGWGVDLIKVDCISDHPYKIDEIRMIRRAIDKATAKTGRAMVLSLSPGPTALEHAAEVGAEAQMWRISDDFWDYWQSATQKEYPQSLVRQFDNLAAWAKYTRPGNWPDADMLPLGELRPVPGEGKPRSTRLTATEQRTLLTLWSMARSPLVLGANLTLLDAATLKLLTNKDVIAIDQHSNGGREAGREGSAVAWTAHGEGGTEYLALFNIGDGTVEYKAGLQSYGLPAGSYAIRDVWEEKTLGRGTEVSGKVEAHAVVLYELKR